MNDVQFKLFTMKFVDTYCKRCKNSSCTALKRFNKNNRSLKIKRKSAIVYEDGTYITHLSVNEEVLKSKKCPSYEKEIS